MARVSEQYRAIVWGMSSAVLVQMNGLGWSLWAWMKAAISALSRSTLRCTPRSHAVEPPRIGSLFDGYHQSTEAAQHVVHHALFLLDVEPLTFRASAVKRARCLSGRGSSKAHLRPVAERHVTAALGGGRCPSAQECAASCFRLRVCASAGERCAALISANVARTSPELCEHSSS